MALRDEADWQGISFVSTNVVGSLRKKSLVVDGYQYATEEEAMLAEMLLQQGIQFTPNVSFGIVMPTRGGATVPFVPDFIFNGRAYVWSDNDGEILVHGLEAKGKKGKTQKVSLLFAQRRVRVLLLRNPVIRRFHDSGNPLPLRPFVP